jgi:hypothetical protein
MTNPDSMKYTLALLVILWTSLATFAQLTDNFDDGDFNNSPEWMGNTDRFQINTGELQLFDLLTPTSSQSSLYLNAITEGETTWEFYVRMDFNPSSSNYTRVYLNADVNDFDSDLNGYFVSIGGTSDVVELRRQTGTSTSGLISSPDDVTDVSVPAVRVRVTRDASNTWELFLDEIGGTNYTSLGTAVDGTHPIGYYFGVRCTYTTTRKDKFFFDDFLVNPLFVDNTPPELQNVEINSSTELVFYFNEPLDPISAANAANFLLDNGVTIASTMIDPANPSAVIITMSVPLINLIDYTAISTVSDAAGNAADNTTFAFTYAVGELAEPYDVLINEIMADPSPVLGLPDAEFVELFNRSNKVIDLNDYQITSGSTPQLMPEYLLLPGEYVVICDDANIAAFNSLGITNAVAVSSFNTLSNAGDNITLTDLNNQVIHAVDYELSWYQNSDKEDGGWTLELINPDNTCNISASNWRASNDPSGGTAGQENSVYDESSSGGLVQLLSAAILDPTQVELTFSVAIDNIAAIDITNYNITPTIGNPNTVTLSSPSSIIMNFNPAIAGNIDYTVTVIGLSDCSGDNGMDTNMNTAEFKLPEPQVLSAIAVYPTQEVIVAYDVAMNQASIANVNNYSLSSLGTPTSATATGPSTAELVFNGSFTNGGTYSLDISNVSDLAGTSIIPTIIEFVYFEPVDVERYDILINEFMVDPTDRIGLPEVEFVELYNRSNKIINLEGFTLEDGGNTTSSPFPFVVMQPGDYLIVTQAVENADGINSYIDYDNKLELEDFISLTNAEDDILLYDNNIQIMDALSFDISWYNDSSKDDGGWSIERISPFSPCEDGDNWAASINILGGTPGVVNSIFEDIPDQQMPEVFSAFPDNPTVINVYFSEAIDFDLAIDISLYSINGGIEIASVFPQLPLGYAVTIILDDVTPLQSQTTYELTIVTGLTDCVGNPFGPDSQVRVALPETIEAKEIIVNEVLFDPNTDGSDFIEIYNNSDKVFNIADLVIYNDAGASSPNKPVERDFLLFPNSYLVLAANPSNILENYNVEDPISLIKNDLPSLSADEGNVSLLTVNGLIDRVDYYEEYHFALLDDTKGVSLERIDFNGESNDRNNWHSAAETAGFATPTYLNSQWLAASEEATTDAFSLADDTFSPDSDGFEDFLLINYSIPNNGNIANIKIFDAKGRIIRDLVQNQLLATEGFYQWDGTNDEGSKARIGIYIVWIEMFDENGNVSVEKETCVLAGQL